MHIWDDRTAKNMENVHHDLHRLFKAVLEVVDFSVLEGQRSPERQARLVDIGASHNLNSPHTFSPSEAVDVIPQPFRNGDWTDTRKFYFFAGIVKAEAQRLNIDIRWGGDWDSDGDFTDQTFNDLVHWELVS